jgi:hypothetical protein
MRKEKDPDPGGPTLALTLMGSDCFTLERRVCRMCLSLGVTRLAASLRHTVSRIIVSRNRPTLDSTLRTVKADLTLYSNRAGLGYLEVNVICPHKSPQWAVE